MRSLPILVPMLCSFLAISCKTRSGQSELKEVWFSLIDSKEKAVDEVSDRNEFIRSFAKLPAKGSADPQPWTFFAKEQGSSDFSYALSSILFAEPKAIPSSNDKKALSSDAIKAKLIAFVETSLNREEEIDARSLGSICRLDSESFQKAIGPRAATLDTMKGLENNDCFKVNPSVFHLSLANFLGLRRQSFLIDPEIDQEFVHYPITSFIIDTLGVPEELEEGHKRFPLKATVAYLLPTGELKSKIYRYKIEVDARGEVVSGEWMNDKVKPQLVWIQDRPRFSAEDKDLEEIYTRSVGLPLRTAMQDFSANTQRELQTPVADTDSIVVNQRYRIELSGDVPRGTDGLKTFLNSSFQSLAPISIYRKTFADEERVVSIEIQAHGQLDMKALKEAVDAHTNGRAEIKRVLR